MKIISFLVIFLTIIFTTQAQTQFRNFELKNKEVQYRKSFNLNNLTQAEVTNQIQTRLQTIPNLAEIKFNGSEFSGKINGLMVDYATYGGKWINTWPILNSPLYSDFTIMANESGYILTLTNIAFIDKSQNVFEYANLGLTKKKGTLFSDAPIISKAMGYIDQFLTDKFAPVKNK